MCLENISLEDPVVSIGPILYTHQSMVQRTKAHYRVAMTIDFEDILSKISEVKNDNEVAYDLVTGLIEGVSNNVSTILSLHLDELKHTVRNAYSNFEIIVIFNEIKLHKI